MLLAVRDLSIVIDTPAGEMTVVDGVSFDVAEGEIMGLVGESGSGKTMIGRALLRLLPTRRARIAGGSIGFAGRDLARLDEEAMRAVRGRDVTMIFQNPSSHLDPVMRVGDQVAEAVARRDGVGRRAARTRAGELFAEVGIVDPLRRLDAYPHELSGGMRQRVMIAAALACRPRLLVADEPTTALDVTVQKQILALLRTLRDRSGFAVILITHDLGVVAETCDSVGVLYAGRLVERGACADLLTRPLHPYTAGLVGSQPELAVPGRRLPAIPGQPPAQGEMPEGCRFHPRCDLGEPACTERDIALETIAGAGRAVACRRWPVLAAAEAGA
jgi:peptide/nickel transport system ATP-binding protein